MRDYDTAEWEGGDPECNHRIDRFGDRKVTDNTNIDQNKEKSLSGEFVPVGQKCPKCGALRVDNQIGLEKTFEEYLQRLLAVTKECQRVLKEKGTLWWVHGDSYSGSNNGSNDYRDEDELGNDIEKKYKGQKPGTNDISDKSLLMQPYRLAQRMVDEQGWILRNIIIWHKPSCMPSSVKDRFTVDFEPVLFFSKNKKYYFEQQFEEMKQYKKEEYKKRLSKLEQGQKFNDYNYKQDEESRLNAGENADRAMRDKKSLKKMISKGRNKRTVWSINPDRFPEAHFAVYPEELIETPIDAGCPEGGIVLDPFMGAGTTAVVARKLNRDYLGIELNPDYIEIAEERLAQKQLI